MPPILCGKEGVEVCLLDDQSTYAGEDPGRDPTLRNVVGNGDTEPREEDEESSEGENKHLLAR